MFENAEKMQDINERVRAASERLYAIADLEEKAYELLEKTSSGL